MEEIYQMHNKFNQAKINIENGLKLITEMEHSFERWKTIEGYPNYKISTLGRVKNIKRGIFLKTAIDKDGYHFLRLSREGTDKNFYVHRLIALAFIPNPDNKRCVDHIDGNRRNNNISNLRFATYQENCRNGVKRNTNTSGFVGVSWDKSLKKWRAQIKINGIKKHLGCFVNIEDAKIAYQNKAKELFGEFYRLQ